MDIEKIKSEIKTIADGIEAKIEKANGQTIEAAKGETNKVAQELKTEIAGMVNKHSELTALYEKEKKSMQEQLDDLSTKMKKNKAGSDEHQSYEQVVKSAVEAMKEKGLLDQLKNQGRGGRGSLNMEVKAAVDMLVGSGGPAAGTIVPSRRPGIITPLTNDMLVRSLMNVTSTDVPIISYIRELAVEGAPAGVAEGGLKPQVSITTQLLQATAKKIAAHSKMSEELMTDVPGFTGYITGRLTDLLQSEENRQILYGAGGASSGVELQGLTTVASAFTDPGYDVEAVQNWDILAATNALLTATPFKLWATGHVINPAQF